MCEHTAEYALVPRLVSILSEESARIIPFYFWASREGNSVSLASIRDLPIRLISVYARRPKVINAGTREVSVKFNAELFDYASLAVPLGIPVFAGLPLASSIIDMTPDVPCVWFDLNPCPNGTSDIEAVISVDHLPGDLIEIAPCVIGPLDADTLISTIVDKSRRMIWGEAINTLRIIRRESGLGHGYFRWFGGYKPFYLLLCDQQ